jgi:hypothetical protein
VCVLSFLLQIFFLALVGGIFFLSNVGPATRVIVVKRAQLVSCVPIAHEGGAIKNHCSLEREDVGIEDRVDGSEPNVRRVAEYARDDRGPVAFVGEEEHMIKNSPLNEIQRPFVLMTSLSETHLFPFSCPFLYPDFVEEVDLDGLEEECPALADGVSELDGLRLPPSSGAVFEFKRCHRSEVHNHLRGKTNELRDSAEVFDDCFPVAVPFGYHL